MKKVELILVQCDPKTGWNHSKDFWISTIAEAFDLIAASPKNFKYQLMVDGVSYMYLKHEKWFRRTSNNQILVVTA